MTNAWIPVGIQATAAPLTSSGLARTKPLIMALSPAAANRVHQKARVAGLDREQYLRSIVSRDLMGPGRLDEVLGAFRNDVAISGVSDEELSDLFAASRADSRPGSHS